MGRQRDTGRNHSEHDAAPQGNEPSTGRLPHRQPPLGPQSSDALVGNPSVENVRPHSDSSLPCSFASCSPAHPVSNGVFPGPYIETSTVFKPSGGSSSRRPTPDSIGSRKYARSV